MHLFALIAVTMCAFAANSVLSRFGIFAYGMDPLAFSGIRLLSGAVALAALVLWRGGPLTFNRARIGAAMALLMYLVPFSLAYLTLPSGVGALILFGVVQITMFTGAAIFGVRPTTRQWAGMAIAMAGLSWLVWPADTMVLDIGGVGLMVISGISWGVFSILGRGSRDPLGDMAMSFILSVPFALGLIALGTPLSGYETGAWGGVLSFYGVATAILSGAVTSGLGYALWYRVLPQVAATTGAVAQLSVPVIAILAGAVLLNETITLDIVLASTVVLGGIAVSVLKRA